MAESKSKSMMLEVGTSSQEGAKEFLELSKTGVVSAGCNTDCRRSSTFLFILLLFVYREQLGGGLYECVSSDILKTQPKKKK